MFLNIIFGILTSFLIKIIIMFYFLTMIIFYNSEKTSLNNNLQSFIILIDNHWNKKCHLSQIKVYQFWKNYWNNDGNSKLILLNIFKGAQRFQVSFENLKLDILFFDLFFSRIKFEILFHSIILLKFPSYTWANSFLFTSNYFLQNTFSMKAR